MLSLAQRAALAQVDLNCAVVPGGDERPVRPLFDDLVRDKSAEREIKADKHKVLTTVRRRGDQLRFASAVMRADKDVVLAAVATCGRALEHASHDLRDDKDVVLAAVRSDVTALRWASVALRADHDVFDVAMNQQPTTSRHDVAKRPRPLVRDHMVGLPIDDEEPAAARPAASRLRERCACFPLWRL